MKIILSKWNDYNKYLHDTQAIEWFKDHGIVLQTEQIDFGNNNLRTLYLTPSRTDKMFIQCIEEVPSLLEQFIIKEFDDENFTYDIEIIELGTIDYDTCEELRLSPIVNVQKLMSLKTKEDIQGYLQFLNIKYK